MPTDPNMTADQIKQLDDNTRLTKEIHTAIVGNETLGHRGLVGRVVHIEEVQTVHEVRLSDFDKRFIRYGGVAFGVMIAFEVVKAFFLGKS